MFTNILNGINDNEWKDLSLPHPGQCIHQSNVQLYAMCDEVVEVEHAVFDSGSVAPGADGDIGGTGPVVTVDVWGASNLGSQDADVAPLNDLNVDQLCTPCGVINGVAQVQDGEGAGLGDEDDMCCDVIEKLSSGIPKSYESHNNVHKLVPDGTVYSAKKNITKT